MGRLVYLAGPITGLSLKDGADWRKEARMILASKGVTALSPLRGKEALSHLETISGHGDEYAHLGSMYRPRGIVTRDRFDCTRCDVLLVNLLGAKRVSIGTMFEIAWADQARIPIVCAIEPEGNVHHHMFLNEIIGFQVPSLEDACHTVATILG